MGTLAAFFTAKLGLLAVWQWLIMALVPPAIIALYFLKLRRVPLEVPSTYLWQKTIEDLHVNSLWQKLKQSILLFLQLLLIMLLILACLPYSCTQQAANDDRLVFLLDVSASMQSTDVDADQSRFDLAKAEIAKQIQNMQNDQTAMLVTTSDEARVEQPFTSEKHLLLNRLNEIDVTNGRSLLDKGVELASQQANPGRTATDTRDVAVAEAKPATLFVYSDGRVSNLEKLSLLNIKPVYHKSGSDSVQNVAVTSFSVQQNPEKPEVYQAFARLENFGKEEKVVETQLMLDGSLRDADRIKVSADAATSLEFELERASLEVGRPVELVFSIVSKDDLAADDVAYAAVNPPRQAQVLFVTTGNTAFEFALSTDSVKEVAEIEKQPPSYLLTDDYKQKSLAGIWDLIIFDRCAPTKELGMPQANTFFWSSLPPTDNWSATPQQGLPVIIDLDRRHQLMYLVEMGNVQILETRVLTAKNGRALMTSDLGTVMAIAPREGFEDVVIGFDLIRKNEEGETLINTNWPSRESFAFFAKNLVEYLGGARSKVEAPATLPGEEMKFRLSVPYPEVEVELPDGRKEGVVRDADNLYSFWSTEQLGIYKIRQPGKDEVLRMRQVNLFGPTGSSDESDILPAEKLEIGYREVESSATDQKISRFTITRYLLFAALAVLVGEWIVYNRRIMM